jgi:hypothetical protein
MTQAGLLSVEQEGRFQRYRANLPLMIEVIRYLTDECCAGHPEQCADLGVVGRRVTGPVSVKRIAKTAGRR